MAAETRRIQKKGVKFNANLEEPLAPTIGDLMAHLQAMGNAVGVSKDYLKRQFNARMMRAELDAFKYPSIGAEYRAKTKKSKIKMTPSDNRNENRGTVDNAPLKLSGLKPSTTLNSSLLLTLALTL